MYQCVMGKRSTSTTATPLKSKYMRKLYSQDRVAHEQDCGESPSKRKSPTPISTPSSSTVPHDRNLPTPCTMSHHQRWYWSTLRCVTPTQLHHHQRKQFTTSTSSPVLNELSNTSMRQQGYQPNVLRSRASATGTT